MQPWLRTRREVHVNHSFMSSSSPIPSEPNEPNPAHRWQVGTLNYTLGGLTVLFCWLLWGDFAWQMKERATQPVVQVMLRKFEASDALNGFLVLSLPALIAVLLGPVISYRSDRHRGRWGRRIPFLMLTVPLTVFSMGGMAFSPVLGTWIHNWLGLPAASLNHTVIWVLGLSWVVLDVATVAASSLFGALVNDVVPRALIGRFYGLFRIVSLGAGMIFGKLVVGHSSEHFTLILACTGLLFGLGMTMMCLCVKEGEYPPPPAPEPGAKRGLIPAVKLYAQECFSKPYYLWVFGSMALAQLSFGPVNLFSVYAAESFGLSLTAYGDLIFKTYLCSLLLAYPLGWLADRIHPIRMGLAALTIYAVVMLIGYFGITSPTSFGYVFLAHGVLSGCYFTGAAALSQMLFPKLKFAQFFSAYGLLLATGNFVLGPSLGRLLDKLGHDYRYTFAAGGLLAALALWSGFVVYRRFMALGGPKGYVAPL